LMSSFSHLNNSVYILIKLVSGLLAI